MPISVLKGRWAIEAVVIVGSILLALASEAWWNNVQEEAAERELLLLLKSQFEENSTTLERQFAAHQSSEEYAKTLLRISRVEDPWPGYDDVLTLLAPLLVYISFDSSSGAVESYLSSGNSQLIDNLELKSQIAAWPSLLQDNVEDEIRVVSLIDNEFKPFLRSTISFGDVFTLLNNENTFGTFGREQSPLDIQNVIQTQEFANFMIERATLERLLQREIRKLIDAAQQILETIDLELDTL